MFKVLRVNNNETKNLDNANVVVNGMVVLPLNWLD
jgi:hypothetical protein